MRTLGFPGLPRTLPLDYRRSLAIQSTREAAVG